MDETQRVAVVSKMSAEEVRTAASSVSRKACEDAKKLISTISEIDLQNLKFEKVFDRRPKIKKRLSRRETGDAWRTLEKRALAKDPSRTEIPLEELAKDFDSIANEMLAAKAELKKNPKAVLKQRGRPSNLDAGQKREGSSRRSARETKVQNEAPKKVSEGTSSEVKNIVQRRVHKFKDNPDPPEELRKIVYDVTKAPNNKKKLVEQWKIERKARKRIRDRSTIEDISKNSMETMDNMPGTNSKGRIDVSFLDHISDTDYFVSKRAGEVDIELAGIHVCEKAILEGNPNLQLENVRTFSNGCRKADVIFEGISRFDCSLFPEWVGPKELSDELIRAINTFSGIYEIEGNNLYKVCIKLFETMDCWLLYNEKGRYITLYHIHK